MNIRRGKWNCLYLAVDKHGKTVDFLLCPDRTIFVGHHRLGARSRESPDAAFYRPMLSRFRASGACALLKRPELGIG
jgi:hypothetical protein